MYVCMYVMYVCMYVCMYVYIYIYTYLYTYSGVKSQTNIISRRRAGPGQAGQRRGRDGPVRALAGTGKLGLQAY